MTNKIKSDASAWRSLPASWWNTVSVVNLADDFKKAHDAVWEIVTAANATEIFTFGVDISDFEISELGRRRQLMSDSTNSIHYEADELLDNPFVRELSALLDKVFALNPKDITVTRKDQEGNSVSYNMDMLLSSVLSAVDPALQADFRKKVNALDNDTIPPWLKDTLEEAIYWQHEYEKAHKIHEIVEATFTEQVRADWKDMSPEERLALLEGYARKIGIVYGDGTPLINTVIDNPNLDPSVYGNAPWNLSNDKQVSDRYGIMNINTKFFNENSLDFSLDHAISTVTHEARHQYQYAVSLDAQGIVSQQPGVSATTPPVKVPSQLSTDWTDQSGYYDANGDIDKLKYWDQPIEIDARAFAGLSVA